MTEPAANGDAAGPSQNVPAALLAAATPRDGLTMSERRRRSLVPDRWTWRAMLFGALALVAAAAAAVTAFSRDPEPLPDVWVTYQPAWFYERQGLPFTDCIPWFGSVRVLQGHALVIDPDRTWFGGSLHHIVPGVEPADDTLTIRCPRSSNGRVGALLDRLLGPDLRTFRVTADERTADGVGWRRATYVGVDDGEVLGR